MLTPPNRRGEASAESFSYPRVHDVTADDGNRTDPAPATHVDDPSPTFISSDIAPSPAPGSERLLSEEACSSGPYVYKPVGGSPGEPECLPQRELGALALRLPRVRSFTRPWRMILAVSSRGVAGGVSIRGLLPTRGPAGTGQPRKANSKHSFHHDLSGAGSVPSRP